ncbi:hypothetical protein CVT24_010753 [Panaeolus cyanescens]|uniref:F-box domain-containing protein n=1 Tax=Panaeolus cyanescens TaxID=181874 RepID=A0A409YMF6_9AGAR|nr:hypothetical protein CVT24_010753 [Panaeolus cyanescens]
MSAKQFYGTKTYDEASLLPNEIWAEIIRWATSSKDKMMQKNLRASLVTKRYLVGVCRQWYNLALPYFYEYILLGRTKALNPLLSALRASATQFDQPPGWWTRRLDVHLRDGIPNAEQALHHLSEIMKELPNLEIWTLSLPGGDNVRSLPTELFEKANCCGHSLRTVIFYTSITLSPDVWKTFLNHHSNIQYLMYNPAESIPLPATPRLLSIWNPWSYQVETSSLSSQYPNLHTIHLDIPQPRLKQLVGVLNQITHLQLTLLPWAFGSFTDEFELLKKIFPCLKRIDFACTIIDGCFLFEGCPLAEVAGIRSSSHIFRKGDAMSLFSRGFPSLLEANPSLKTIQFTDKADLVSLSRVAGKVRDPLLALQEKGVQVLDDAGGPLKI